MTAQITWSITALDCKPQEGPYTDVVVTDHWTCNGVDGEYSASVYATCSFTITEGQFTPYNQLTQQKTGPIEPNNFIPYADLTLAAERAQIIADCTTKEAAINAATTVDELMAVVAPVITAQV